MFNKENILNEINKDLSKEFNGDLFKCRLILFQYFQLKYLYKRNRDYVGYILYGTKNQNGKIQYTLNVSEAGTLNNAKILVEVKNKKCIKIDNYYWELLTQFYKMPVLREKIISILKKYDISYDEKSTPYKLFLLLKNYNENIFKNREYFAFRFFKLSDKYAPYETVLWDALKEEFSWRLKYPDIKRVLWN